MAYEIRITLSRWRDTTPFTRYDDRWNTWCYRSSRTSRSSEYYVCSIEARREYEESTPILLLMDTRDECSSSAANVATTAYVISRFAVIINTLRLRLALPSAATDAPGTPAVTRRAGCYGQPLCCHHYAGGTHQVSEHDERAGRTYVDRASIRHEKCWREENTRDEAVIAGYDVTGRTYTPHAGLITPYC